MLAKISRVNSWSYEQVCSTTNIAIAYAEYIWWQVSLNRSIFAGSNKCVSVLPSWDSWVHCIPCQQSNCRPRLKCDLPTTSALRSAFRQLALRRLSSSFERLEHTNNTTETCFNEDEKPFGNCGCYVPCATSI